MTYRVIVSPNAQREIEDAIEFYTSRSIFAPKRVINVIKVSYDILSNHPFLCVRYKNVRSIKLSKFPFSSYYILMKKNNWFAFYLAFITREIRYEGQNTNK